MTKPTIPEVLPLARAYFAKNPVWGSLHVVLDEGNVKDSHVQFCIEFAEERGDHDGLILAKLLLRMSRTQRLKIAQLGARPA